MKIYGVERMRALLAVCALIEGVPMLYQGDEDPAIYGGQGRFERRVSGADLRLAEGAAGHAGRARPTTAEFAPAAAYLPACASGRRSRRWFW